MLLEYHQFEVLQLPSLSPVHYLTIFQVYCVVMISNYSTTVSGPKEFWYLSSFAKPGACLVHSTPCSPRGNSVWGTGNQTGFPRGVPLHFFSSDKQVIPCRVPTWRLLSCD